MGRVLNRTVRWAVASLLIAASLLPLRLVTAQTDAQDTVSLGISPQLLDVTANPGETIRNTFRLTNASAGSIEVVTTPKNFTPRGEEGAVDLTVDDTDFSLADWIVVSPSESVAIEPGKTQDYEVAISVPETAEPGSHFGSVVFQTVPPENDTANALVSQEIAPVILVRIAGDTTETAEIAEFRAEKSVYSNEDSVQFYSRIENTGNVHFKPTAKITIENMFGSQVAELDVERRNVLPSSIRQLTTEWQPEGFQIGRYTATLSLVYGENDEIRVATTSVTFIPWQTIVPIVLLVGIIIFVMVKFNDRLKRAANALRGKDQPKE